MFKALLEDVPGVDCAEWQTSKTLQRNVGDHYCEHNLLVFSRTLGPGSASRPIEFELTRHQHMKDPNVKPTLTAMFKDPPDGLIAEAWRILLAATKGKQLLPMHVTPKGQYRNSLLTNETKAQEARAITLQLP